MTNEEDKVDVKEEEQEEGRKLGKMEVLMEMERGLLRLYERSRRHEDEEASWWRLHIGGTACKASAACKLAIEVPLSYRKTPGS